MSRFARSEAALEYDACQADCPAGYEDKCACEDYEGEGGEGAALVSELRGVVACKDRCAEPDWSCLGSVHRPSFTSRARRELHVGVGSVPFGTLISSATTVTACQALDGTCGDPATAVSGVATLLLDAVRNAPPFEYLWVRWLEADAVENSARFYFFPPIQRNPAWTYRRVVSRAQGEFAAVTLHEKGIEGVHPLLWNDKGGIIWSASACNGIPAAGLTAELTPPQSRTFYIRGNFEVAPDEVATTSLGLGAMLNVDPGSKTLLLKREGEVIGTYTFYVAIGTITTLALAPTPDGGF